MGEDREEKKGDGRGWEEKKGENGEEKKGDGRGWGGGQVTRSGCWWLGLSSASAELQYRR